MYRVCFLCKVSGIVPEACGELMRILTEVHDAGLLEGWTAYDEARSRTRERAVQLAISIDAARDDRRQDRSPDLTGEELYDAALRAFPPKADPERALLEVFG